MAPPKELRHTLLLCLLALFAGACGRSPVAGLEGELCAADDDCIDGLVCVRRSCLPIELFDMGSDIPPRGGLFFVVLELDEWAGATGGQLEQFGQFVSDLSTILTPYYGMWAYSEIQGRFGVVDRDSSPLNLSTDQTITTMRLDHEGATWLALQDNLLVPVVYSDDNVALDFEMPISDAQLTIQASDTSPGQFGVVRLSGALRAVDSRELEVVQGDEEFTLWDVLRGDPLDVDIDDDGVNDSWALLWTGTGVFF